ncbi:aminoacyl-tRNA hydrolase [Allopusillimonas soli]|uniref:Aminoacyl-tRNA hydrolase n=1 Tax=Allopusillimonas soli TaxID=659016 RepID=A0A853F9Y2_9BURK|nr:alternative ribosome rescue aminoacyl-tRNA hydrolase ArfB [Allopusillimonas soli]NYT36739.1 aminoacyl-tRNA hydrolase [Allopusillimonas soli]TEA75213.1 aminoacyl-tRNA hydrolase [Allopusillimonas soli]
MLPICDDIFLDENELEFSMIRAQGTGGQHVNKVSSAVQLRLDINRSSLPEDSKRVLLSLADSRVSKHGIIVIKAQTHRSQALNRADAVARLISLLRSGLKKQRPRWATRPTRASQQRRVQRKQLHGQLKRTRERIQSWD